MGLFARLSDLISANLNSLLDAAEDPERMLAQVIREMELGLADARQQGACAIAAERRLGRELEQNRAAAAHWKEQARLALNSQREDLARKALARKLEHDDLVRALDSQWTAARQTSTEVKAALHALEARLAEARRKQRTLLARHRAAAIRLQAQRTVKPVIADGREPLARFARFEDRLIDMEDQLLAQSELLRPSADLEIELADLESARRVEDELKELKKEMEPAAL
jgi:phage shock protein A